MSELERGIRIGIIIGMMGMVIFLWIVHELDLWSRRKKTNGVSHQSTIK